MLAVMIKMYFLAYLIVFIVLILIYIRNRFTNRFFVMDNSSVHVLTTLFKTPTKIQIMLLKFVNSKSIYLPLMFIISILVYNT